MSAWQPIDTAPKDGTFILIWGTRWRSPQVQRWGKVKGLRHEAFVSEAGLPKGYLPTHWMPLPDPPAHPFITAQQDAI